MADHKGSTGKGTHHDKDDAHGKGGMGKVGQAAEKGEQVARGMSEATTGAANTMADAGAQATRNVGQAASTIADAGAQATRSATQTASTMADAGAQATRNVGQAAQGLAGAGANAARSVGQAAAGAMTAGFGEFSKMFENLRMPAMPDMDTMLGAYRRNLEALSAANRVALEGAQQVARRNMEIMQQTMGEMTEAMRNLTSSDSPQDRAGKQTELLKHAYERAVNHMKELADLIQRSNGEALDVLNQRFVQAMDEVQQMADKTRGAADGGHAGKRR